MIVVRLGLILRILLNVLCACEFNESTNNFENKCIFSITNKSENVELREGLVKRFPDGEEYCAYLGIPYAKPPVGNLRFEAPIMQTLEETFELHPRPFREEPNWCLQAMILYANRLLVGSEDCLFLNVFTSKRINNRISASELLSPVVVWIHGGSFNYGSISTWSDRFSHFVEKDIVVVAINYRLGSLGFMSAPEQNLTGNYGLMDQQMALKWIQRHIKYFGGDPNNVTLLGWSAGAASISYHLYSKSSINLFHRAILMSGTLLSKWAFDADPNYCAEFVMNNVKKVDKFALLTAPKTPKLARKIDLFPNYDDSISKEYFGVNLDCFLPTLDEQMVTSLPQHLIETQPAALVPILIGAVAVELNFNVVHVPLSLHTKNVQFPNQNSTLLAIISDYLDTQCDFFLKSGGLNETNMEYFTKFLSEIEMHHGVFELSRAYSKYTAKSNGLFVYRYAFGEKEVLNHGDDVQQILPKDYLHRNTTISQRMAQMWENFIKTGSPIPKLTSLLNISWPTYDVENEIFLNIDSDLTVEKRKNDGSHVKLWNSIYICLYKFECGPIFNYINGTIKCIDH